MIWIRILGEVVVGLIKLFFKDKFKREEYQNEIERELTKYQEEADTSANIREEARDARDKLKERNNGNANS